jgi:DNA-binding response OmpR family regulator
MRILHVENDPITVRQVELILQDVAGECETTALGEHAVQLAAQKTYDLILLDVMLPDIDGCEVIERLRSAGVDTPYLIISGLVDRESDFGDLALGIGDYLAKPFTRDELISRVTAVIARSKLAKLPILEEPLPEAPQRAAVERRRHRRFKTIKSAKIDHGDGICCKILNMSHGGAAIRVTDDQLDLPTTFSLELAGGTTHVCRIIWRESDKIGVKFLDRS